ncbi:MAG: OmpH family outer membrane protein [Kiritimatiellae bacterium]|nr:OmpH family outer membrane protein [Kiritimatiellia bacterium]
MKRVMNWRMSLVAALAAAWLGAAPLAQAQGEKERIVFVDMNKVFDDFYKTKLAQDNLKDQEAEFKEELQKQVDEFKALQDKFKKVREESEDRVLNEDARNARRAEAEEMLVELREMESKIRRFEETKRRQVADTMKRVRDNLVVEIKKTLADYAKSQGFLAVLDASGDNMNGVPNILFFDETRDITSALLDLLNSGKK